MYTILEYRIDCALGLISEADRRSFLKKMGQIGGSIATGGGPVGVIAKMAMGEVGGSDPLAHISDDEIIDMPEKDWINLIPSTRLLKILARNDYDVDGELTNKLMKVVIYGVQYMAKDTSLEMMKKYLEKVGYDTKRGLFDALTNSDIYHGAYAEAEGKMAANGIQALEKIGISVPSSIKRKAFEINSEMRQMEIQADQEAMERDQKRKEDLKRRKDRDNDAKYNNAKMHQPFESKLEKALSAIFG